MEKKPLLVVLGDRRYRVERPFGQLPQGKGTVSDVAVDARGHVYVLLRRDSLTTTAEPAVYELDPDGRLLAAWGEEVQDAHMIACAPDGRIFVVDRDLHLVRIYDAKGEPLAVVGEPESPGTLFNHPTDVAFLSDGRFAVSDGYVHAQVHIFSGQGRHLQRFGRPGQANGEFFTPHAICVPLPGRLLVADRENHRLQLFTENGEWLATWTGFFRPQSVWTAGNGLIYVTDAVPSLSVLDLEGNLVGRCRPVLNGAHGLAGDAHTGVLYLAEGNPSRLTRLVPTASL